MELPLWLNNRGAVSREHRPLRSRSCAAFTVSAEVCLVEAGSDMGVSVGSLPW